MPRKINKNRLKIVIAVVSALTLLPLHSYGVAYTYNVLANGTPNGGNNFALGGNLSGTSTLTVSSDATPPTIDLGTGKLVNFNGMTNGGFISIAAGTTVTSSNPMITGFNNAVNTITSGIQVYGSLIVSDLNNDSITLTDNASGAVMMIVVRTGGELTGDISPGISGHSHQLHVESGGTVNANIINEYFRVLNIAGTFNGNLENIRTHFSSTCTVSGILNGDMSFSASRSDVLTINISGQFQGDFLPLATSSPITVNISDGAIVGLTTSNSFKPYVQDESVNFYINIDGDNTIHSSIEGHEDNTVNRLNVGSSSSGDTIINGSLINMHDINIANTGTLTINNNIVTTNNATLDHTLKTTIINGNIEGPYNITNTSGNLTVNGNLGASTALRTVTSASAAGSFTLNGNINLANDLIINEAMTISGATSLVIAGDFTLAASKTLSLVNSAFLDVSGTTTIGANSSIKLDGTIDLDQAFDAGATAGFNLNIGADVTSTVFTNSAVITDVAVITVSNGMATFGADIVGATDLTSAAGSTIKFTSNISGNTGTLTCNGIFDVGETPLTLNYSNMVFNDKITLTLASPSSSPLLTLTGAADLSSSTIEIVINGNSEGSYAAITGNNITMPSASSVNVQYPSGYSGSVEIDGNDINVNLAIIPKRQPKVAAKVSDNIFIKKLAKLNENFYSLDEAKQNILTNVLDRVETEEDINDLNGLLNNIPTDNLISSSSLSNIDQRLSYLVMAKNSSIHNNYMAGDNSIDSSLWVSPLFLKSRSIQENAIVNIKGTGVNTGVDFEYNNYIMGLSFNHMHFNGTETSVSEKCFSILSNSFSLYTNYQLKLNKLTNSFINSILTVGKNSISTVRNFSTPGRDYNDINAKYDNMFGSLNVSLGVNHQVSNNFLSGISVISDNTFTSEHSYKETSDVGNAVDVQASSLHYVGAKWFGEYDFLNDANRVSALQLNFKILTLLHQSNGNYDLIYNFSDSKSTKSMIAKSDYILNIGLYYTVNITDDLRVKFSYDYQDKQKTTASLFGLDLKYSF